ncbi:MAG: pyroglutamyl-peptidase I [Clostridia bacterium]|nr:pyroglutamyl-peptidase I [Clostridia bacterium]
MKILVTAFEPFGGDAVNSSLAALRSLPETVAGARVCRAVIPVVFGLCGQVLTQKIREIRPDGILCLGMAAGRGQITPEVFAVNARYARSADNGGMRYDILTPCAPAGPDAYRTKLPAETIVTRLQENGIPASLSFTAGTYVCNDLFYSLMHIAEVPAGFIHVPQAAENAPEGRAAMPQAQINRGIALALEVLAETIGQ